MKRRHVFVILFVLLAGAAGLYYWYGSRNKNFNPNPTRMIGQAVDSLDGVNVYYNGAVANSCGRNTSDDGYNLGIKFQCVEFVKRYYYEHFHHKMPDSYGNAKDFFDATIPDGKLNPKRDLLQFTNPSKSKPRYGDLLIFDAHIGNPFGHVAIVSKVADHTITIIQQNPGPFASPRVSFPLDSTAEGFSVREAGTLGWLRIK